MYRLNMGWLLLFSFILWGQTSKSQLANTSFPLAKMKYISTGENSETETYLSSESYRYYGIIVDTVLNQFKEIYSIKTQYIYGLDISPEAKEEYAPVYLGEDALPTKRKNQKHVKAKEWFIIEDADYKAYPFKTMRTYHILNRNKAAKQVLVKDLISAKAKPSPQIRQECFTQTFYDLPATIAGYFYLDIWENICDPDASNPYYDIHFYTIKSKGKSTKVVR